VLAHSVVPLPIDRVIVDRVDAVPTVKPGCTSYTITANTVEDQPRRRQYQTVRELDASACQRSKELQIPIRIRWKRTNYGNDITRVEIER